MAYLNFNHALPSAYIAETRWRPIMNEEKRLRRINIWELID